MEKIRYCKGYKYQLREDYTVQTNVKPPITIEAPLVTLTSDGLLTIKRYFAWDGCSGPTWDDKTNMRACLVHDAFYYLMRIGVLSQAFRTTADYELRRMMVEDGALEIRAEYYHLAVSTLAGKCANPCNARKTYEAP